MNDYETRRAENIKRNQELLKELNVPTLPKNEEQPRPSKKRKLNVPTIAPTRTSSRIASSASRPSYNEDASPLPAERVRRAQATKRVNAVKPENDDEKSHSTALFADIDSLRAGWTSWKPTGTAPTRSSSGRYQFGSHPDFQPNKSPEEIIREGCFGGSYFRPLYSKALDITIKDDWKEIPESWLTGLDIEKYLISSIYDPEINKYRVACGQSIEEWEAAGWINHQYDIRGWFQWYCRFFMGRRCDDDERQISRWKKCVGDTGRWRRILLKKYLAMGIRSVFAEDEEEEGKEVSPVVHQTCHHWAYEVRQEDLDRFWGDGK